ncbi:MAG TPA: (5-formylfuran-3-yl)methyl phosphate synthase [Xanthobacteraceae bacterium]|nr:(5-formylfuran-3-yl)methyl phosphate synthase [Xanthobacteraceae bacterium]
MTLLLARVRPSEAADAVALGADIVDLEDASATPGALAADAVRAALRAIAGRRPASATVGDLPLEPETLAAAAAAMAAAGVQYVKVGLLPGPRREACVARLAAQARDTRLIAVLFADRETDASALPALLARLRAAEFAGAMLDTADRGARLIDRMDIPALAAFVDGCRANALMAGLAGSLEPPDVPRLLALAPAVLGFGRALRADGDRTAPLDAAAFRLVRELIPPASADVADAESSDDYATDPGSDAGARDHIFVRDFVVPVRIGAYAHERDRLQRLRFNVDVAVLRPPHAIEDMRDVLSYDIITDGIRMVAAQEDIALLETLAERIAAVVLSHARAAGVTVRVEKLDVGSGTVGVKIERARPGKANVRPLYSLAAGTDKAKAAE